MHIRRGRRGTILQGALLASAFAAFVSVIGFLVVPLSREPLADIEIVMRDSVLRVGDIATIQVMVSAQTPVNVFAGEIGFDHALLQVESIDYNTSIAELWAEAPWYQNGDGTIGFIGGTTRSGGFLGRDMLMTIAFRAVQDGDAVVHVHNARVLAHDGIGSDVALGVPIDTIVRVAPSLLSEQIVALPDSESVTLRVRDHAPSTDINGDGKQTITDVSIFLLNMLSDDSKYDFNEDGKVDTKDLRIIMSAK